MAKPVIITIGKQLCTFYPFCGKLIYERERGKYSELCCDFAFASHAPTCKENPDRQKEEFNKLKKKMLEGSD